MAQLEGRLQEWDARLNAAAELTTSTERQFTDREAAVSRWEGLFTRWRELIQRPREPIA